MTTAYYAIVRYVPDVARGEYMNVGVVVALPETDYLHFDLYATKTRLSQLDPYFDKESLESFGAYLKRKLSIYKDQIRAAFTEHATANGDRGKSDVVEEILRELTRVQSTATFQLSAFQPAYLETEEPEQLHAEILLQDLMERYVEPPRREAKTKSKVPSLRSVFSKRLRQFDLLSTGRGQQRVKAHYRLTEKSKLDYDYGFRNGHVHLLELVDLVGHEAPDEGGMSETGTALMKFVEAKKFEQSSGEEVEKYTVLRASNTEIREFAAPIDMLKQLSGVYNISREGDMEELIDRLRKALREREGDDLGLI